MEVVGGGENPQQIPPFFQWAYPDFGFQASYQAFMALRSIEALRNQFGPRILSLQQAAGAQQDHLVGLSQVTQFHSQAIESVCGTVSGLVTETATLAQTLQPLQLLPRQIEVAFQQLQTQGANAFRVAAETAQKVIDQGVLIQSLTESLQKVTQQANLAVQGVRYLEEKGEHDKQKLLREMAKLRAENDELRQKGGAEISASVQNELDHFGSLLKQVAPLMANLEKDLAVVQKSAKESASMASSCREGLGVTDQNVSDLKVSLGQVCQALQNTEERVLEVEQGGATIQSQVTGFHDQFAEFQSQVVDLQGRVSALERVSPSDLTFDGEPARPRPRTRTETGTRGTPSDSGPPGRTANGVLPPSVPHIEPNDPPMEPFFDPNPESFDHFRGAEPPTTARGEGEALLGAIDPNNRTTIAQFAGLVAQSLGAMSSQGVGRVRPLEPSDARPPPLATTPGTRLSPREHVASPPYAASSSTNTRSIQLRLEGEEPRTLTVGCGLGAMAGQPPLTTGDRRNREPSLNPAEHARINVLDVGYPGMMPFRGSELWTSLPKPRFSGQPTDYARFETEWEDLERILKSMYPCADGTQLILSFKECLDEATRTRLTARMRQCPRLTLTEFKRELRREFGVDTRRQNRRDWEALPLVLSGPPGNELTLPNWRQFVETYKLYREAVPERTHAEEWRMIFTRLPLTLRDALIRESAKRREKYPWVRITYPTGADPEDILTAVEAFTQEPLPNYRECTQGFIFLTKSEEERDNLLRLHNCSVHERFQLSVSQHEYEMSGDEILAFVSKRLEQDELVRSARDAYGTFQPSTASVHAMGAESAELQVVKFAGESHPGRSPHRGGGERHASPKSSSKKEKTMKPRADTTVCSMCRRNGRSFLHDFRQCEHFRKAADALAARWPALANQQCRTCKKAKRPADHDYRKCEYVWANGGKMKERIDREARAATPANPSE
jgi:hypothetical protein